MINYSSMGSFSYVVMSNRYVYTKEAVPAHRGLGPELQVVRHQAGCQVLLREIDPCRKRQAALHPHSVKKGTCGNVFQAVKVRDPPDRSPACRLVDSDNTMQLCSAKDHLCTRILLTSLYTFMESWK